MRTIKKNFTKGDKMCYLVPEQLHESLFDKQYGNYFLPMSKDMNGNGIIPIWVAYDDNFMSIWTVLRSLDKIKYKPVK